MVASLYRTFEWALQLERWPNDTFISRLVIATKPEDWPVMSLPTKLAIVLTETITLLFCIQLFTIFFFPMMRRLSRLLPPDTRIIVDSGASLHVCNDKSKLLNYRPYYIPVPLVGVGGFVLAPGGGDMEITTIVKDSDNTTRQGTLHLYDVVYAPITPMVVISTQKLRLQGIFYSSEKAALYRKQDNCDVVVGQTTIDSEIPYLKEVKETVVESWCSSLRLSWYDRWLTTRRGVTEEIPDLETGNGEAVDTVESHEQESTGLETSISCQLQSDSTE